MSSKKKRNERRFHARELAQAVAAKELENFVCPECGMRGEKHWVQTSMITLATIFSGVPNGFWVCPKFYDETGRRIDT